jgi:hypothetical protein
MYRPPICQLEGVTSRMLTSGPLSQSQAAAPFGADFTVPDGAYGAEQQVWSRGESRAPPAMSDRVNILGVGATPQDLDVAVATLDWWRARAMGICLRRFRTWPGGGAARSRDSERAQPLRHRDRGRNATRLVVTPHRFPPGTARLWLRSARRGVCFWRSSRFRYYFFGASPKVVE